MYGQSKGGRFEMLLCFSRARHAFVRLLKNSNNKTIKKIIILRKDKERWEWLCLTAEILQEKKMMKEEGEAKWLLKGIKWKTVVFFASHFYLNGHNFGIFQRQSDIMTICFYPLMERSDRCLTLPFMRYRFNSRRSNGDCLKREAAPASPLKSKVEVVVFFYPLHYCAVLQRQHGALSMIISHWLSCCERHGRGARGCMHIQRENKQESGRSFSE